MASKTTTRGGGNTPSKAQHAEVGRMAKAAYGAGGPVGKSHARNSLAANEPKISISASQKREGGRSPSYGRPGPKKR